MGEKDLAGCYYCWEARLDVCSFKLQSKIFAELEDGFASLN